MQHKNKEKGAKILTEPSLDPILDEEIEEKVIFLDAPDVEEDSYKACIVYLLLNMSSLYMERRHYSEALKCLNEAETYSEDKLPDVFFRRSQARTYNKYSSIKDLELAMIDLEKAIESNIRFNERNKENYLSKNNNAQIYEEHKEKLNQIITKREKGEVDKTTCILKHSKESMKLAKQKNIVGKSHLYHNGDDQIRQFKILNE